MSWSGTDDGTGTGTYTWSDVELSGNGRFGETLATLVGDASENTLVSASNPASCDMTVSVDGDDDRFSDCDLYLEAYPTDTPDVDLFDVDVIVRGRMVDDQGNYVLSMPAVRMVGNVVQNAGSRRCEVTWVDGTQVRFVSGGEQ
jgi:hypothetical protein